LLLFITILVIFVIVVVAIRRHCFAVVVVVAIRRHCFAVVVVVVVVAVVVIVARSDRPRLHSRPAYHGVAPVPNSYGKRFR